MKKQLIIFSLSLFTTIQLKAQTNTFPTSGNVGVGTTNPLTSLHVKASIDGLFTLQTSDNSWLYTNWLDNTGTRRLWMGLDADLSSFNISTQNGTNKILLNGANVGIGTTTPSYKLDINGTGRYTGNLLIGDPNGARTEINTSTNHMVFAPTNKKTIDLDGNYHGGGFVGVYRADNGKHGVYMRSQPSQNTNSLEIRQMKQDDSSTPAMSLASVIFSGDTEPTNYISFPYQNSTIVIGGWGNYKKGLNYGLINKYKTSFENDVYVETGNVGIGTTTPDEKLAVNGNIHTKEVRVDLIGWSDFVFENDYKLPTLQEVEQHIKENGHLQNIPSAKEVEENGILLGDMNAKLLQKIEELTLYTIEQDKKLKAQDTTNQELKERLLKLEQFIAKNN